MSDVGSILSAQPAVASLSIDASLRPKLEFLRELGVEDVGAQIERHPACLTLSLESNLRPTADALCDAGLLGPNRTDNSTANLTPRHLAASLRGRILPRLQFAASRRQRPSLNGVTILSDSSFCNQARSRRDLAERSPDCTSRVEIGRRHISARSRRLSRVQLGCELSEWSEWLESYKAERTPALSIPWLPDTVDLGAMLADAPAEVREIARDRATIIALIDGACSTHSNEMTRAARRRRSPW